MDGTTDGTNAKPPRGTRPSAYCCVTGCHNHNLTEGVKLFGFPRNRNPIQSQLWAKAVDREELVVRKHTKICSKHFVLEQPNRTREHPDYVPSIFPTGHVKAKTQADVDAFWRNFNKNGEAGNWKIGGFRWP